MYINKDTSKCMLESVIKNKSTENTLLTFHLLYIHWVTRMLMEWFPQDWHYGANCQIDTGAKVKQRHNKIEQRFLLSYLQDGCITTQIQVALFYAHICTVFKSTLSINCRCRCRCLCRHDSGGGLWRQQQPKQIHGCYRWILMHGED